MKIIFSDEQTRKILKLASGKTEAEVNADVEPSGYVLRVAVGSEAYGFEAHIEIFNKSISLGDVEIELEDGWDEG